jgi:hypothetical protein
MIASYIGLALKVLDTSLALDEHDRPQVRLIPELEQHEVCVYSSVGTCREWDDLNSYIAIAYECQNLIELVAGAGPARSRKPDSGHTGTISITVRVRRASPERHESPDPRRFNAVESRIQCVLTH